MAACVLVTGGNKGIGRAICARLLQESEALTVILTARDATRGEQARAELAAANKADHRLLFQRLDITDSNSIDAIAAWLKTSGQQLRAIVNNAGIAYRGDDFSADIARDTISTNCYAGRQLVTGLLPLLGAGGRIINVTSQSGCLHHFSPALRQRFLDPGLTESEVIELMEAFIAAVQLGRYQAAGWPGNTYTVSKAGMNALTRVWARDLSARGITVAACCPGWCRTDMGGDRAGRTAAMGADTPVWLTLVEPPMHDGFFADRRRIDW